MSTCPHCGAVFGCGMVDTNNYEPCWCAKLPALPSTSYATGNDGRPADRCLCPNCLRMLLNAVATAHPKET